ncbi:MAG TPA: type III pantothenate kinase [Candidatus Omnitrophota bacterium]|nr:type III pantothenate kinase [Candidatus Omnitrophota bacterium]
MVVAIDIGNTSISFGVLQRERVIRTFSTEVQVPKRILRAQCGKILQKIGKRFPNIECVVICSVVPGVLAVCRRAVSDRLRVRAIVIGQDIKVPMRNNYRNPKQVGQDRLVCAYAAKCLYGQPAIVVDFGTATTFDVVSPRGSYEGGIIVSGIRLSAEALFQKTALLPRISLMKGPRALIGKNTQESILSGIFHGYGAMSCGLIERISRRIKGSPKVIVTGGYTRLMKQYISKKTTIIDKHLVFKGIALVLSQSRRNSTLKF